MKKIIGRYDSRQINHKQFVGMIQAAFFTASLSLGLCFLSGIRANAAETVMDYLTEHVCINSSGVVVAGDPYAPPAGDTTQRLVSGESLTYAKYNQVGNERKDSYLVSDAAGNPIVINPFYYASATNGEPDSYNGAGIYMDIGGWASSGQTSVHKDFCLTFFGNLGGGPTPYNGWLFFPDTFVTGGFNPASGGYTYQPWGFSAWESDGIPWPGASPASNTTGTSWSLIKKCVFGGISPNPPKTIDAIQSVYGYQPANEPARSTWLAKGHLEVFYFTDVYGLTRWESWRPLQQLNSYNANAINAASSEGHAIIAAGEKYGYNSTAGGYIITASYTFGNGDLPVPCFLDSIDDWTVVTLLSPFQLPPPTPTPHQNILGNFHFDTPSGAPAFSPWNYSALTYSLQQSTTTLDTTNADKGATNTGVRYLRMHANNTPPDPQAEIYQYIPRGSLPNGIYTVTTRIRCEPTTGTKNVEILLEEISSSGTILAKDIDVTTAVGATNAVETQFDGPPNNDANTSVILSSTMLTGSQDITINANTVKLLFIIRLKDNGDFDVIDANVSTPNE